MTRRTLIIMVATILVVSMTVVAPSLSIRSAGNSRGYAPAQPIRFSHRLHVSELEVDCRYCHSGVERSKHAGIPTVTTCMNCHRFVTATKAAVAAEDQQAAAENRKPRTVISPEIAKVYDALALGPDMKRDTSRRPEPVEWLRIHKLPDFVSFDHSRHVNAGVDCESCHGAVRTMERVQQFSDLSMGWCVNCHREANRSGIAGKAVHASLDCSGCHQ